MTRVLIADGQLSIRQRLRQMLERNRDVQVVGEASDASSTSIVTRQLKPDILLIDLGLCQQSVPLDLDVGGSASQRTIVMLAAIDKRSIVEAFRLGAQGILPKTAAPAMWGKPSGALWMVNTALKMAAWRFFWKHFAHRLPCKTPSHSRSMGLRRERWRSVAKIAAGNSNREVGQQFSICERTVKHHLTNILIRLESPADSN